MLSRHVLREELEDLQDLLNELEAGQARWEEFGPALLQLRGHTGLKDNRLADLVEKTILELRNAGTAKLIDQARSVVLDALTQLKRMK